MVLHRLRIIPPRREGIGEKPGPVPRNVHAGDMLGRDHDRVVRYCGDDAIDEVGFPLLQDIPHHIGMYL